MSGFVQSGRFSTAAWTPLSLGSTMKLWLDADDAATFTYSSGVVVSQWNDKSGNNNHAAQATVGRQPTRSTAQINGKAAVRFPGGSAHYFEIANFASGFTAGEVFLVFKTDADPASGSNPSGLWQFTSDTANAHVPFTDGNVYDHWGTTARKSTGNPTASFTSWRLYNVRSASGAWSNHIDGTQHYSTATNTVGFGSAAHLLGAGPVAFFLVGYIAAVIICDTVLSSGDRTSLHTWAATEYGLTIA